MKKTLELPIVEIIKMYENGLSSIAIAKIFKCNNLTIIKRLRDNNIVIRNNKLNLDDNKIIQLYIIDELSTVEISKIFNCCDEAISKRLKKNNIKLRGVKKRYNLNIDEVMNHYDSGLNTKQIANIYNCSTRTINYLLHKNNIKRDVHNKLNLPVNELYNAYNDGVTIIELSKKYNCSTETIYSYLRKTDIIFKKEKPNNIPDGMDYCYSCETIKQLSEFNKDITSNNKHSNKCRICSKLYRLENKDKINKTRSKYTRNRRDNNINVKILDNSRRRINSAVKDNCKSKHTMELIGCTIDELKIHLQKTADVNYPNKNFDINNYSGQDWHIDHIKPCSSFNMEDPEEQAKCFHYTNLQILTAQDNLRKYNN